MPVMQLISEFKTRYFSHSLNFIYRLMQSIKESNHSNSPSSMTRRSKRPSDHDSLSLNFCQKKTKVQSEQQTNRYEAIPEIPTYYLSAQEMNSDPIALLDKLEKQFQPYGAVKLTCSQKWNPPFNFRYVDKGITTRIQKLQDLKQGKVTLNLLMLPASLAFEQNIEAYSISSFTAFANNFENCYKYKTSPKGCSLQGKKEQEYWNLVTCPEYTKKQVKVEYAADLSAIRYGSGFPSSKNHNWKDADFSYEQNLFNLNNIAKSENSLLKIAQRRKQKISGISHTWVYMGMMFSTFCWHVEDLWVNSINYNHKGGVKTWYIVPGQYKQKFDEYIKKKYCQSHFKKSLLQRITFMADPLELIDAGIPVYKTYQNPRDYVCTFLKAYHCGFSQGFNVGEAVNFLSPKSLGVMLQARKAKKLEFKQSPNIFPIEWLITQNFKQRYRFNKEQQNILEKLYQSMMQDQKKELQQAQKLWDIDTYKKISDELKYDKIMCSKCKEYLYLIAYQYKEKMYCCNDLKNLRQKQTQKEPITLLLRSEQIQRLASTIFNRIKFID